MNELNLHDYQRAAVRHIIDNPAAGLFIGMGLGKTVITLTAVSTLMHDRFEIGRVLVIAPKRVAEVTWAEEWHKWEHLSGLSMSLVLGDEKKRLDALARPADIYVINREMVVWLVEQYQKDWPFDMVVIDELSSFKSAKAARFKALKRVRPRISRIVGLTGTPAPNSLLDLWPQMYLLDMGERLGKTITGYRVRYFVPNRTNGHIVFDYKIREGAAESIYGKIGDICLSMAAKDYLQLPPRTDYEVKVYMDETQKAEYLQFEKEQVMKLAEGGTVSAVNAAVLSGKLLQFANGAVYNDGDDGAWTPMHDKKLEALEEIVEVAAGEPVLVFYNYKHDLSRILARLRRFNPKTINSTSDVIKWNSGQILVLLAHPASAGHGLNLQAGGRTIVWFGLNWSLELYQQANARLDRQGQTKPVKVYHITTQGTIDTDVMRALAEKSAGQQGLIDAVKARLKKYITLWS